MIQVNQEASDERGTEASSVHILHGPLILWVVNSNVVLFFILISIR